MTDILESFQKLFFLRLTVLLFDKEAVKKIFFGEFSFGGGGVNGLFDDVYFAITDGDGDEFEKHLDVLTHGLVGLTGDAHPVIEKDELLAVLTVVDHRNYSIRLDFDYESKMVVLS